MRIKRYLFAELPGGHEDEGLPASSLLLLGEC